MSEITYSSGLQPGVRTILKYPSVREDMLGRTRSHLTGCVKQEKIVLFWMQLISFILNVDYIL
jgi:hypothetical protein